MNDTPRYATLRDYLRVLREQRRLIVLVGIVFAAAALALSLSQQPSYQAESSVTVQDEIGEASLLGNSSIVSSQTATTRASLLAANITRPEIVAEVKRQLRHRSPASDLQGSVSATDNNTNNTVTIDASAKTAAGAAALASTYANAAKTFERGDARSQYASDVSHLQKEFRSVSRIARDPVTRSLYADRIGRLKILSQTADPVQINHLAAVPSSPSSPRPIRDTLLGLLIGLTLGILAAFTRDSLDRRLRSANEVTETLGWPIMGQLRDDALGRTGLVAAPNGRGPTREADFESIRILRQNLQFLDIDNPPRSIVVTSALPEEGKSTVALALACASAAAGRRTLLVECDLRRPSLGDRLGIAPAPGLSDYLLRDASRQQVLQQVPLIDPGVAAAGNGHAERPTDPERPAAANGSLSHGHEEDVIRQVIGGQQVVIITAGRRTGHEAELLGSERCREFLRETAQTYETVVLDTPPLLSVADTLELMPHADAALLCVRANRTTREQAAAVRRAVERLPERPTGLVITGVRAGSELDFGYYSYSYSYAGAR